jgi:hypothetical protein
VRWFDTFVEKTTMTTFAVLTGAVIVLMLMIAVDFVSATLLYKIVDRVLPNNWYAYATVRGICGLASPIVAFVLLAVGVASIVPPPQAFTYASIDVNPEATFFQRNAAYIAIETGLADVKVHPGVVYSTATWKKSKDETKTYIGLPGAGKWYSL